VLTPDYASVLNIGKITYQIVKKVAKARFEQNVENLD